MDTRLGEAEMARLALALSEEPEPETAGLVRVDPERLLRGLTGGAR